MSNVAIFENEQNEAYLQYTPLLLRMHNSCLSSLVPKPPPVFAFSIIHTCSSTSVYYTERKPKNKKWGEARERGYVMSTYIMNVAHTQHVKLSFLHGNGNIFHCMIATHRIVG